MPFSQDSEHQKQFGRQRDIVPGVGVLFPALNPSLKPLIVPPGVLQWKHQNPKWSFKIFFLPWHHSMKPLIVPPGVFQRNQRYCQWSFVFPVQWNLSGYPCCVQETFFADTLHKLRLCIPSAGICVSWNWGRWIYAAQRCTAHASAKYIDPWPPSTAELRCWLEASSLSVSVACCWPIVWGRAAAGLVCTGGHLPAPPFSEKRVKMLISYV